MTIEEILARVEALPVHSIGGYEWECDICKFRFKEGRDPIVDGIEGYYDPDGVPCNHDALLDRERVLECFRDPR